MGSIAAREVAKEVLETIGRGERPVLRKIAVKKGYSQHTADNPVLITETQSYQQVISPIIEKMEKEREAAIKAMKTKRGKANYSQLTEAVDKLTKNIQLLSGGKTENIGYEDDRKRLHAIVAELHG